MNKFLEIIREKARKEIIYSKYALDEMSAEEEIITVGEIIEDYPEDKRGHSCLMLGYTYKKRPVHVVCSPKRNYLMIITAYIPDRNLWNNFYKKRRKR